MGSCLFRAGLRQGRTVSSYYTVRLYPFLLNVYLDNLANNLERASMSASLSQPTLMRKFSIF